MNSDVIVSLAKLSAAVAAGFFLILFIIYRIFGKGMIYRLWLMIFPGIAYQLISLDLIIRMGWSENTGLFAVVAGANIGIMLIFFIFTGKYFEKHIIEGLKRVNTATGEVSSASAMIANSGHDLAQTSSEQAASLQQTSTSLEELTATITQNRENAGQANEITQETSNSISGASASVNTMRFAMNEINMQSSEMAKIIKTIDDIAFQTNLLALNAAVEAARAGESGKGFAVVAEEVRNLAKRSAEAAKYTSELINSVRSSVGKGVSVTEEIDSIFKKIVDDSNKAVALVSSVASASAEQSKGVSQINTAVSQLDITTQNTSAAAEESASTSQELSFQSENLKNMVNDLTMFVTGKKTDK